MEIIMKVFPESFNKIYYGVNKEAGKVSSAKERLKSFEGSILQELEKAEYTLNSGGSCKEAFIDLAEKEGYLVEEYYERPGMYFLIHPKEEYVSLVAVGIKIP